VKGILRAGVKITGFGVLSVVGALFSGPWGPCGPATPIGALFMLAAMLCLPVGGVVLLIGLIAR